MAHPIKHFVTITRHRHTVIRHCFKAGIGWQGLFHDLSKYSPTEFIPGAKYYAGDKSPNVGERRDLGYSLAWLHHQGRNRHHFEYWMDYSMASGVRTRVPIEMPTNYLIEMFCDRVAACKIYMGDRYTDASGWEYFDRNRGAYVIHPATCAALEKLLAMLRDEGEEKTFAYIRRELLHKK